MPRKLAHIGTVQKIKEKRGEKKVRIKNPIQFKGKRKRMSQSGLCVIGKKVFELSQIEKLAIGNGLKQKDVQSLTMPAAVCLYIKGSTQFITFAEYDKTSGQAATKQLSILVLL